VSGRKRTRTRSKRRSKGQALVEFVLVVPVLLLIMSFALDLGRAYSAWVTLNNLSRIGANNAAQQPQAWQGSGDASLQAQYRQLIEHDARGMNCTLTSPLPDPSFIGPSSHEYDLGAPVQVTLTCKFTFITPLIGAFLGDSKQQISMSASSVFGIRNGSIAVAPPPPPPPPVKSISLAKSASPQTYGKVGDVISYSYMITNTGNVALGAGGVVDDHTTVTCPGGTIAPLASVTCHASYTITAADITAGSVTNLATASVGTVVSNTDHATVVYSEPASSSFFGTPADADCAKNPVVGDNSQGGCAGSTQLIVAWNAHVPINWTNTSVKANSCSWDFGSGTTPTTSSSCSPGQSIYTSEGVYTVQLTVNGNLTSTYTVIAACQVPNFQGVSTGTAAAAWSTAGFTGRVSIKGRGNEIASQSIAGGTLAPGASSKDPGGCGAKIDLTTN
jgi:PKD repeat protein